MLVVLVPHPMRRRRLMALLVQAMVVVVPERCPMLRQELVPRRRQPLLTMVPIPMPREMVSPVVRTLPAEPVAVPIRLGAEVLGQLVQSPKRKLEIDRPNPMQKALSVVC